MSTQLPTFFERIRSSNPFLENRINGSLISSVDAPEVHQQAHARLTELALEVRRARNGLGVVLWGEAGVGKSHVLGRLRHWAADGKAHLIYIHNLQASTEGMARSFLHTVVHELLAGRRDEWHLTPLYRMVESGILEATSNEKKMSLSRLERSYRHWLNNLGSPLSNSLVWDVLFAFFRSALMRKVARADERLATLATRWLTGSALDPEDAQLLHLPPAWSPGEAVGLRDAEEIKHVLLALSRLAACQEKPFILAIDQVDNLNPDQFGALSRFLEALLDSARNLLVITTGIQSTLDRWYHEGVVQKSAWDRLAQFKVIVQNLPPNDACQLIRRRIGSFFAENDCDPSIQQLHASDPYFPLGQRWIDQRINNEKKIRARDVISWASEAWHAEQLRLEKEGHLWLTSWSRPRDDTPPPPPPPSGSAEMLIDAAIEEEMKRYPQRANLAAQAPNADRLASILHNLLNHCTGERWKMNLVTVTHELAPRDDFLMPYQLRLTRKTDKGNHVTGIVALCSHAKTSNAARLRRLANDKTGVDRIVVILDARVGLPLGDKGDDYHNTLRSRPNNGYLEITLTIEEINDLETLDGVIGRAKSQDIEIQDERGTRAATVAEVVHAYHRHDRFRKQRLIKELLRE